MSDWMQRMDARGGVACRATVRSMAGTKTQPIEKTHVVSKSRDEHAPLWDVIVWNDPVNLMTYVVHVLQRIFGYNRELATKLMLEVHHQGRSVVATEPREKAEMHLVQLHGYGLQATLRKGLP